MCIPLGILTQVYDRRTTWTLHVVQNRWQGLTSGNLTVILYIPPPFFFDKWKWILHL